MREDWGGANWTRSKRKTRRISVGTSSLISQKIFTDPHPHRFVKLPILLIGLFHIIYVYRARRTYFLSFLLFYILFSALG